MPRNVYPVSFREKFIAALADHEGSFRDYCARFGVSHETGYQWLRRVAQRGLEGLEPTSSAPREVPHATSLFVTELLVQTRQLHPTWGPRKIRQVLQSGYPNGQFPAPSTIGDILKRAGLILARKRRRHASPTPLPFAPMVAANSVWTADWKGQFRTADGRPCYPLTIADGASRYLLRCAACTSPSEAA